MNSLIENLEGVLVEAHKTKGWQFAIEPLWVTWSLEKFGVLGVLFPRTQADSLIVTSVPAILIPYHRSLQMHAEIVDTLRSHSASFEISREAISRWVAQPYLEEGSWEAEWEDLCEVEIDRWNSAK